MNHFCVNYSKALVVAFGLGGDGSLFFKLPLRETRVFNEIWEKVVRKKSVKEKNVDKCSITSLNKAIALTITMSLKEMKSPIIPQHRVFFLVSSQKSIPLSNLSKTIKKTIKKNTS